MKGIAFGVVVAGLALAFTAGESAYGVGFLGQSCCDADQCCDASSCDNVGSCGAWSARDACGVCGESGRGCGCLGRMKLLGCIKPSDRCFDDFISPMINFVFFEDPRTLSEVRPIFVNQHLPSNLANGNVQLYALQFRIALTERLSLIAVKDGFIVDDMSSGPVDGLVDDGWAAVTAGLKYNFLRDACSGTLASAGFTYEIPLGTSRASQSIGDGEFHVFGTAGQRLLDGNAHLLTAVGYRFPVDDNLQSSSMHWSNHFDVRVTDRAYLVTELAWWHWTESAGSGLALGIAGQDLFNLSSTNVAGNDLVTQNVGLKFKPKQNIEAGIAYEFPLTGFKDVIDDRFQLDLIFRY